MRASYVREFVERVRAGSAAPVEYVELPGAHHGFDLYESIRSAAANMAVESFIEENRSSARLRGLPLPE